VRRYCAGQARASHMLASNAMKARMKLTRPMPDRRFAAGSPWKLSAPFTPPSTAQLGLMDA